MVRFKLLISKHRALIGCSWNGKGTSVLGEISKENSSRLLYSQNMTLHVCCLQAFCPCLQDRGVSSLNVAAKCACFAACCGSAWPSTTSQWHHSTDTSTSVMGPRIWTSPSYCKETLIDVFQAVVCSYISSKPKSALCSILHKFVSTLKTNKLFSCALCLYRLSLLFSSHA